MSLRRRHLAAIVISIFLTARICGGQTLSLPLHGYFHPGRAMPVAADFSDAGSVVELSAQGAIASRVSGERGTHVVFPFLTIDADVRGSGLDLHVLEDSDRLIGDAGDDPAAAAKIFAGQRIVTVRLDPVNPIPGPAMAWETLDGLLLTPIGLANIPERTVLDLSAAGVTIAVSGGPEPGAALPWQKKGGLWIAGGVTNLPSGVLPDAYSPTLQWIGGKSWAFRRRTILLGVLFALMAGGICLWRSNWAVVATAGLAAAFCCAAAVNNRGISPVVSAEGIMHLEIGRSWAVADAWVYEQAHRDADFDLEVSGLVHPIALENSQWKDWNLVLTCGADGVPISLSGRLKADEPVAVVMRRIAGAGMLAGGPVDSPVRLLVVPSLYGEYEIAGQNGPPQSDTDTRWTRWGTVVLNPLN